MAELHILVVIDTDTREMRLTDMSEAPVDSRESAWDADDEDEWRQMTEPELDLLLEAEAKLAELIAGVKVA